MRVLRPILTPFFFMGRLFLWVVFFPLGIWRSLVHHRKKGERHMRAQLRKEAS